MKRKTKIIIVIGISTAASVLLLMALSYEEHASYECLTCRCRRRTDKWGLCCYFGPSLKVWSRQVIRRSNIYKTLFTTDHQHKWAFVGGYSRYGSGLFSFHRVHGVYRDGSVPLMNDFCGFYETFPAFRDFIQAQIAEGKLTQDQVCRIVELPSGVFQDQNSPAGNSELAIKARRIFDEFNKM